MWKSCATVPYLEVRVCECVLDLDALVGVEGEELVEQVDQLGTGGTGEELLPRHLGTLRQRAQEVPSLFHKLIRLIGIIS